MFRVVSENRGFLQLLADRPAHQRQFLLKTATPPEIHALVQIQVHFPPDPKKISAILRSHKDALLHLARPSVLCKTKKLVLVQESSGFIEDLLAPVQVSSLGFLMLLKMWRIGKLMIRSYVSHGTHQNEEKDRFGWTRAGEWKWRKQKFWWRRRGWRTKNKRCLID